MKSIDNGKYILEESFSDKALVAALNRKSGERVALKRIAANRESAAMELRVWRESYSEYFRDSFQENGWVYIERAWIEGQTLFDRVKQKGKLGKNEAITTAIEIARELAYFYDKTGLVYGDLTPTNIIICKEGVRLVDFESATPQNAPIEEIHKVRTIKFITPGYFAPEKTRGISTLKSDLFSFGKVILFMLTGETEMDETGDADETYNLINYCTEADPENRPENITYVEDELKKLVESGKKTKKDDELLFKHNFHGYRRLILYVRENIAFASEFAGVISEYGFKVGICELCDMGEGTLKYYFAKKEETGKQNLAAENAGFYGNTCGVCFTNGDTLMTAFENEAEGFSNLCFDTKKLDFNEKIENDEMRDFMVKCYAENDVTIVVDDTCANSENSAQLMRYADYAIIPVACDADTFENTVAKAENFFFENAIPFARLKIIGWNFSAGESISEDTQRKFAGASFAGKVSSDTARSRVKNLEKGVFSQNMPTKIKEEYKKILDEFM